MDRLLANLDRLALKTEDGDSSGSEDGEDGVAKGFGAPLPSGPQSESESDNEAEKEKEAIQPDIRNPKPTDVRSKENRPKSCRYWTPQEQIETKKQEKEKGDRTEVYCESVHGSFDSWAGAFPSLVAADSGIRSLKVIKPGLTPNHVKPVSDEEMDRMTEEFGKLRAEEGDGHVTRELMFRLGKKYGLTTGKWMVMVGRFNSDKVWQRLCKDLLGGALPAGVICVRMDVNDERSKGSESVRMNVMTGDFTNREEVFEAERAIIKSMEKAGLDIKTSLEMLKYKAEIYSHLNIFRGNKFGPDSRGLPPSIYQSEQLERYKGSFRGRGRGGRGRGGRDIGGGRGISHGVGKGSGVPLDGDYWNWRKRDG